MILKNVFYIYFQLTENGFRVLCVSLGVFFGAVESMNHPRMDILFLISQKLARPKGTLFGRFFHFLF